MIHLIWLGKEPDWLAAKVQHFRDMAVGCEVVLHTDDREVLPCYRTAYNTFARLPQTRSDFIRQSVLELYGGWYFDLDATLLVPIDRLAKEISGTRYVTTTFGRGTFNPDVLFCPRGWEGWPIVHRYMQSLPPDQSVGTLAFADRLIRSVASQRPDLIECLEDMRKYPYRQEMVSPDALVLRQGIKWPDLPEDSDRGGRKTGGKPCGTCRKLRNYAKALARWSAAGLPIRSDEQVEELYSICSGCEEFEDDTCTVCGCPVKRQDKMTGRKKVRRLSALRNKLRMATERCPRGKWKAARQRWRGRDEDA